MMEKSAQPGEGGGVARSLPFTISTIKYEVVVYTRAERADTLPLFLLYPYKYSVQITINVLLDQRFIWDILVFCIAMYSPYVLFFMWI